MTGAVVVFFLFSLLLFIGGIYGRREDAEDAERFRSLMDKAVEAAKGKMTRDDFRKAWDAMKYETEADGSVSYSLHHAFNRPPEERN